MQDEVLYDRQVIEFLEHICGDGSMSPGGPEEVARVLSGVDVAGKHMLDIGSGSGACAVLLACEHRAARVTGSDVEELVCIAGKRRVEAENPADRVEIELVGPGPFPFDDVNRNPWYAKVAVKVLDWLSGPDRDALSKRHGADFIDHQIAIWTKFVRVLESGEHCLHHIRARKLG